jgi:hypothetical protein
MDASQRVHEYQRYLDPIIEEFTTGEQYEEVYRAKQEYFEKAGVVYEDDREYDQRMSIFMDWYLFERDLPGVDLPPVKYFFRKNKERFTDEELQVYKDLCNTIHSVFRLKRFSLFGRDLIVQDLFTKKTFRVKDASHKKGFTKGDIFEARLIPFKGRYEFSMGFCFHPIEMEPFILSEIKKVRHQDKGRQTRLILQLASMKLKHTRFQHIDIRHIYTFDSRF